MVIVPFVPADFGMSANVAPLVIVEAAVKASVAPLIRKSLCRVIAPVAWVRVCELLLNASIGASVEAVRPVSLIWVYLNFGTTPDDAALVVKFKALFVALIRLVLLTFKFAVPATLSSVALPELGASKVSAPVPFDSTVKLLLEPLSVDFMVLVPPVAAP